MAEWQAAPVILRPFVAADRVAVLELWHACGLTRPWNDESAEIDRKLAWDPSMLVVAADGDTIAGTVMIGYDGRRGWVNYVAVAPGRQGSGLGRRLMQEAEARLRALGCPKLNLQVRGDNLAAVEFYRHLGYELDDVVGMGKRLDGPPSA